MNKLVQNVVLNFAQFALIPQCILYIGPELCVYFNDISVYRDVNTQHIECWVPQLMLQVPKSNGIQQKTEGSLLQICFF